MSYLFIYLKFNYFKLISPISSTFLSLPPCPFSSMRKILSPKLRTSLTITDLLVLRDEIHIFNHLPNIFNHQDAHINHQDAHTEDNLFTFKLFLLYSLRNNTTNQSFTQARYLHFLLDPLISYQLQNPVNSAF